MCLWVFSLSRARAPAREGVSLMDADGVCVCVYVADFCDSATHRGPISGSLCVCVCVFVYVYICVAGCWGPWG